MIGKGWIPNKDGAEVSAPKKEYSLSPEQKARDAQKLQDCLDGMPAYIITVRKALSTIEGSTRAKGAACQLLLKLTQQFRHAFFVEGGTAYEGNYVTLNLPSHKRMIARGISGQRTDIIARLKELDRHGFIDFEKEKTQDFDGWKLRIPLERDLDRWKGEQWEAQGGGFRPGTAHVKGLEEIGGDENAQQPIHHRKNTTENRLPRVPSLRSVDFSLLFFVSLDVLGVTRSDIELAFGMKKRTVQDQLKLMVSLNLIERVGRIYRPLSPLCLALSELQKEVDSRLIKSEAFEKGLEASLVRQHGLLDQLCYRQVPLQQKRSQKVQRAIRAIKAMIKAHRKGVAPSVYLERRYT